MDIRKGNCWRCEGPGTGISCKKCGKATYCRERCCTEDKERHRPQCEMWSPTCSNPGCRKKDELKECSSCNNAYYCSSTCQCQHWKKHKTSCRERVTAINGAVNKLLPHFLSNAQRALRIPYYIGNDIAMDLLNLQGNELSDSDQAAEVLMRDYSILSAGCGNIRNLLCTVTSLPEEFQGKLRFMLNDIDPFIQARNLLFLFMMIHLSSNLDIASIIATIWYSLHLPENVHKILIDSLNIFCNSSMAELKEISKDVINVNEEALEIIRQVWQGWLKVDQQAKSWRSVSLIQQREQMFRDDPLSAEGLESYQSTIHKRHRESAVSWVQNGDFLPSGKTARNQQENPTLTGRRERGTGRKTIEEQITQANTQPKDKEFVFCVLSDLMPFGEWDYIDIAKYSNDKSLIVMSHAFVTHQIQETISFINKQRLCISLNLGSCLDIAEGTSPLEKYDRIFTSNMADYTGTRVLLNAMKPLLSTTNKNAVIVTHSMNWCKFFPNSYADYPMHQLNGSLHKWVDSARKDTGRNLPNIPRHWYQEYFNNSSYFINYLRADLMASNRALGEENADEKIPTFQEVKQQCSGLRMRDFRYQLNKVAPWKYRQNARTATQLSGTSRMLEWFIP